MNYRRPTCPGERQAPIETKQAEPGEWRVWARRYGLGKCPVCDQWIARHKDGTLVQHAAAEKSATTRTQPTAEACVRCGSADVRTFAPLLCGPCYVAASSSEETDV